MKKYFPLLFALLFIFVGLPRQAAAEVDPSSILIAAQITAKEYVHFLNENENQPTACSPPAEPIYEFYDSKMSNQILRFGEPGNYAYELAFTAEPDTPIFFISSSEATRYSLWKNTSIFQLPSSSFCMDRLLKTNHSTFSLIDNGAIAHEAVGEGVIIPLADWITDFFFLGSLVGASEEIRRISKTEERSDHTTAALETRSSHDATSMTSDLTMSTFHADACSNFTLPQHLEQTEQAYQEAQEVNQNAFKQFQEAHSWFQNLKRRLQERSKTTQSIYNTHLAYYYDQLQKTYAAHACYAASCLNAQVAMQAGYHPDWITSLQQDAALKHAYWIAQNQELARAMLHFNLSAISRNFSLNELSYQRGENSLTIAYQHRESAKVIYAEGKKNLDALAIKLIDLRKAVTVQNEISSAAGPLREKIELLEHEMTSEKKTDFSTECATSLLELNTDQATTSLREAIFRIINEKLEQLKITIFPREVVDQNKEALFSLPHSADVPHVNRVDEIKPLSPPTNSDISSKKKKKRKKKKAVPLSSLETTGDDQQKKGDLLNNDAEDSEEDTDLIELQRRNENNIILNELMDLWKTDEESAEGMTKLTEILKQHKETETDPQKLHEKFRETANELKKEALKKYSSLENQFGLARQEPLNSITQEDIDPLKKIYTANQGEIEKIRSECKSQTELDQKVTELGLREYQKYLQQKKGVDGAAEELIAEEEKEALAKKSASQKVATPHQVKSEPLLLDVKKLALERYQRNQEAFKKIAEECATEEEYLQRVNEISEKEYRATLLEQNLAEAQARAAELELLKMLEEEEKTASQKAAASKANSSKNRKKKK